MATVVDVEILNSLVESGLMTPEERDAEIARANVNGKEDVLPEDVFVPVEEEQKSEEVPEVEEVPETSVPAIPEEEEAPEQKETAEEAPEAGETTSAIVKRSAYERDMIKMSSPGEVAAYFMGDKEYELEPGHPANIIELTNELPKKAQDKARNLFEHLANNRPLHIYTRIGLDVLSKRKELVLRDLVAVMTTGGTCGAPKYRIGTARSQAGQVKALFRKFLVIDENGKMNEKSNILAKLQVFSP